MNADNFGERRFFIGVHRRFDFQFRITAEAAVPHPVAKESKARGGPTILRGGYRAVAGSLG
ncbi:hypothetical protein HYR69_07450 [Candidatus Sumerlaeota bacterium]|nr:hypothetical protein [Candidatus Sumerlaeota bacterium]MBI3736012.1 hypothetical protein [Candidatus Sumerlaeota bacterium]